MRNQVVKLKSVYLLRNIQKQIQIKKRKFKILKYYYYILNLLSTQQKSLSFEELFYFFYISGGLIAADDLFYGEIHFCL